MLEVLAFAAAASSGLLVGSLVGEGGPFVAFATAAGFLLSFLLATTE